MVIYIAYIFYRIVLSSQYNKWKTNNGVIYLFRIFHLTGFSSVEERHFRQQYINILKEIKKRK